MLSGLNKYRVVAIVLWMAVGIVAGLAIGSYFDLTGRQQTFPVVLVAGIFLLIMIRIIGNSKEVSVVPKEKGSNEARQWLDDFLIKQQGE